MIVIRSDRTRRVDLNDNDTSATVLVLNYQYRDHSTLLVKNGYEDTMPWTKD
jgi:hypothetical protein